MRHKTRVLVFIMTLAAVGSALMVVAGCTSSARAQLRTATDGYASTVNVLADLRNAGLIDQSQAAKIEVWRSVARAALDEWRAALEAGEPETSAIETYNTVMAALTKAIMDVEAKGNE
jgi:outer membrane murein-binding lipoprotein Lpp